MAEATPEPTIDLLFLLNQASWSLSAQLNLALAALGISIRDYCVLWKALEGDRTQKEIADAALLDKTTMVTTVDGLEAAGLAERRPSPVDRRARLITVTPAGRRIVAKGKTVIDEVIADVLDSIPARQQSAFLTGLQHLVDGRLALPSHVPGLRRSRGTTIDV